MRSDRECAGKPVHEDRAGASKGNIAKCPGLIISATLSITLS